MQAFELFGVDAGESSTSATDTNNTSCATRCTTKQTIEEIWGSKATPKIQLKSMSHKKPQEKLPVNLLFILV